MDRKLQTAAEHLPMVHRRLPLSRIGGVVCGMLMTGAVHGAPEEPAHHQDLERTSWGFLLGESVVSVGALIAVGALTEGPRETCRWCETNSFDESIRTALRADNPRPPASVSDVLVLGVIPALGFTGLIVPAGIDGQWHRGLEDSWIIVNSFLLANALSNAVKGISSRERPAFHFGVESETVYPHSDSPEEQNSSFMSGHTAVASSVASSAATLAFLRGYGSAPYLAVGGGLLATTAGMLRISADLHWATDVLAAAALGSGVGIALPLLLHGRRKSAPTAGPTVVSVTPLIRERGLSVAGVF
jgi:membrane-associated phospholipid phosphatase